MQQIESFCSSDCINLFFSFYYKHGAETYFKTFAAASHNTLLWGVITGLSFLSVIISGTMYGCYLRYVSLSDMTALIIGRNHFLFDFRLKTKWWDSFGENPKLLDINPSKHEVRHFLSLHSFR